MDGGGAQARQSRFPADAQDVLGRRSPAAWRVRLDGVQARHAWLAVAIGLSRKRQDDQATYLGALVGHYLLMSTLPLLVSFTWILGRATAHDPSLRRRVTDGLVGQLPVLGDQLRHGTLHGSAAGLALLLVFAVLAGLAVLVAAQNASATVWGIPKVERSGGLAARARSLIIVVALGLLLVAWALVSGVIVTVSAIPVVGRGLALGVCVGALTLVVAGLFAALSPGQREHWWQHWPGALATAVGWTVLQWIAAAFIRHEVVHWGPVYGTFALVIALLAWLALVGQVMISGVELNVVLAHHLYPRALAGPPREADRRAAALATAAALPSFSGCGGRR